MENDLRYKILNEFREKSTGETISNDFLETLHYDLGTIKRAIIELIDSDLLSFSNLTKEESIKWLNKNVITTSIYNKEFDSLNQNIQSSKRLIKDLENSLEPNTTKKIPPIRLYTTVKGLIFLSDYNDRVDLKKYNQTVLKNSSSNTTTNWIIAISSLLLFVITCINSCGNDRINIECNHEQCCEFESNK